MWEDWNTLVNFAGDLLFGCEATWLSELVWNCKTVGGKLLICTSTSEKKRFIKNPFKQDNNLQCCLVHGSCWRLCRYSLWESRLVVGYLGRLGEGFQARAHAARALKVPHVTRWRYVTERVNPVWAINWTHVTQTTVLFCPCGSWFLVPTRYNIASSILRGR